MAEAIVETRGDGSTPYQTVIKFGPFGLRLHIFWRGDGDPDWHDHPADFWTFPLVSYVEEYPGDMCFPQRRIVEAFRLHRRKAEFAHRVLGAWGHAYGKGRPLTDERPIVTLVWWGRKRREWGFHDRHTRRWTPWREYVSAREAA